jgi:hypothetical protein
MGEDLVYFAGLKRATKVVIDELAPLRPSYLLRNPLNKQLWRICALQSTLPFTVLMSRVLNILFATRPLFTITSRRPTAVYSGVYDVFTLPFRPRDGQNKRDFSIRKSDLYVYEIRG